MRYPYRNIKCIGVTVLESKLFNLTSSLILDTPPSDDPDKFVCQLEQELTNILNELAPLRYVIRNQTTWSENARWLSEDAIQVGEHPPTRQTASGHFPIQAKQLRRRLERRWKKTNKRGQIRSSGVQEVCRDANMLINASRNRHRYDRIMEVSGDSRRVVCWRPFLPTKFHIDRCTV